MASKYNQQNEAKLLFRGHCPLHARRRFIGALEPEAPLDHEVWAWPSPPPSWGCGPPATKEHALNNTRRPSCCSHSNLADSLLTNTLDGRLLNSGVQVILSA